MAKYRLNGEGVIDTERGFTIPNDEKNRHWLKYQEWLGEGNTPDPMPTPEPLTNEQLLEQSDRNMIRVVDWLLQYLVTNGAIPLADIPAPVKQLYLERKALRGA